MLRIPSLRQLALFVGLYLTLLPCARAQYQTQTVRLQPGWNAVHLELDPAESECARWVELSGGRIVSIWSYHNRHGQEPAFEPSDFNEDLAPPPVRVPNRWQVFHPGHAAVSNLFHLRGGRAYLFRVDDAGGPLDLEVTGKPITPEPVWVTDDYSFCGFYVDTSLPPEGRPTFAEYFRGSAVHLDEASLVFGTGSDGQMQGPLDKSDTRIESGRAYWVYTAGVSDYGGPVELRGVDRRGVDFGAVLSESEFVIANPTPEDQAVTLRLKPTDGEAPEGAAQNVGDIRLSLLEGYGEDGPSWLDLDAGGVALDLPADGTRRIRLHVVRQGLPVTRVAKTTAPTPSPEVDGSYQGELELATASGVVVLRLPIVAEVPDHTGLWVGHVRLQHVRQLKRADPVGGVPGAVPASELDCFPDNCPKVTSDGSIVPESDRAPEMAFPVILHVGTPDAGDPDAKRLTLLRQVALMWRRDPGRYALITREGFEGGLLDCRDFDGDPTFVGGALRDGRRFSFLKTAPTFHGDAALGGPGGGEVEIFRASGAWTTTVSIAADDPLNPYLHRYHPDHGHPRVMRQAGVPASGGKAVSRHLTFSFAADDPERPAGEGVGPRVGYGDTILGGVYREVIEDLTYHPVVVQGIFELKKVVGGIAELNDGLPVDGTACP